MAKKNSAGKYRGRVQIGVDKDGKAINKYVCASTQRELEEKKDQVRKRYIEGVPTAEDMLFYEYAETWYKLKKEPDLSIKSKRICYDDQKAYSACFWNAPSKSHHRQ